MQKTLNILVACEFSGIVRDAFNKISGNNAISCDLLPSESDKGEHYEGDIYNLLSDHNLHFDLMIAHPPCTFLTNSGVRWLYNSDKSINEERWNNMIEACNFFNNLLNTDIKYICIENPIMHKYARERIPVSYQQKIQPWQFGHGETKATCLWLKNLPNLTPTDIVSERKPRVHFEAPGKDRWKNRSRTYTGIAKAMATQWTEYIRNDINSD